MKYFLPTVCLFGCLAWLSPVRAQVVSIKSGESIDLHGVYWIENCRSKLKSIVGIEVLESPQGIALSLREEPVKAQRQNCADLVPGATVVATAREVSEGRGTLKYRIRYDTENGPRHSSHTQYLYLVPTR